MGMMDNIKDISKMKQMADSAKKEAESLRAIGKSKRGYVSVTLDGDKSIKKIELSDQAMDLKKQDLAKYIKDAHRVAAKDIDKQMKKQFKNSNFANMIQGK